MLSMLLPLILHEPCQVHQNNDDMVINYCARAAFIKIYVTCVRRNKTASYEHHD